MKKGESFKYLGYTIKMCENNDGIVLLSPKGEHYGNFGESPKAAKKHALINYMLSKPELRQSCVNHIAQPHNGGCYHDHFTILKYLKEDGLTDEVPRTQDLSFAIDLNGFNSLDPIQPAKYYKYRLVIKKPEKNTIFLGFNEMEEALSIMETYWQRGYTTAIEINSLT